MEDKKKTTIDKICRLSKQDSKFGESLRKRLGLDSSSNNAIINDERFDEVYEYCIEKIMRRQAEDFYMDFPLRSIVPVLVSDYVRMESFRRKDAFCDFCLALYQQIECITNRICESKVMDKIVSKMWAYPAFVTEAGIISSRAYKDNKSAEYLIAHMVFSKEKAAEKSKIALQSLYAMDKIRTVVYFIGYLAMPTSNDFNSYVEITTLLNDIYQCRNTNHRGNTLNPWEEKVLNRILPLQSLYYFKFLGALAQFVEFVRNGVPKLTEIGVFANSLPSKTVPQLGPKILGKIDLSKFPSKKKF